MHVRLLKHLPVVLVAVGLAACDDPPTAPTPVTTTTTTTTTTAPPPPPAAPTIGAPGIDSPRDDEQVNTLRPTLVVNNAAADQAGTAVYEFQIADNANFTITPGSFVASYALVVTGSNVPEGGGGKTQWTVDRDLQPTTRYYWRARKILTPTAVSTHGTFTGPYSVVSRVRTRDEPFSRAGALWDPLTIGRSIGAVTGVTFEGTGGARINDLTSNIMYRLAATVSSGEHSMYVDNLDPEHNGDKTKLMFHMEDNGQDPTVNEYRKNVEFRGDDHPEPGLIRLRIITGDPDDHFDSERIYGTFNKAIRYFVRERWGNGRHSIFIAEGGPQGKVVVDASYGYDGTYGPDPHLAYVGAPVGRGGPADASATGIRVSGVFIGTGTRPDSLGSAIDGR
jgi:hypothetical protein